MAKKIVEILKDRIPADLLLMEKIHIALASVEPNFKYDQMQSGTMRQQVYELAMMLRKHEDPTVVGYSSRLLGEYEHAEYAIGRMRFQLDQLKGWMSI